MPAILLSTGSNSKGQLAHSGVEDSHVFQPTSSYSTVSSLAAPTPFPPTGSSLLEISSGGNHTLAVIQDESGRTELWGTGDGSLGQLGALTAGSASTWSGFKKLSCPQSLAEDSWELVGVGSLWSSSVIVLEDKFTKQWNVWTFGSNDFGELGRNTHTATPASLDLGHLHFVPGTRFISLACGPRHILLSCASQTEEFVLGWGAARNGQLHFSSTQQSSSPSVKHSKFIPPSLLARFPARKLPSLRFSVGMNHSILLSPTALKSYGRPSIDFNTFTSNVNSLTREDISNVASTWSSCFILDSKGQVFSAGSNTHSQLGRTTPPTDIGLITFPSTPPEHFPIVSLASPPVSTRQSSLNPSSLPDLVKIKTLVSGSEHLLAICEDNNIFGWGWNEHGNLGDGTTLNWETPRLLPVENHGRIRAVWAGCGTSWILIEADEQGGVLP